MLGGRSKLSWFPSPSAGGTQLGGQQSARRPRVTWGHWKDLALPCSSPRVVGAGLSLHEGTRGLYEKPSPAEGNQALFPLPGAPCCSQGVWVPNKGVPFPSPAREINLDWI